MDKAHGCANAIYGCDTMSEVARDYAYLVKINKDNKKPDPTISLDMLKKYQADVEKYFREKNDKL